MPSFIKNIIAIGGLLALAGLGYYLFVVERNARLDVDTSSVQQADVEAQQFTRRLQEIETIKLDPEIFSSGALASFVDFSVPIESTPVGRDNPFRQ